MNFEMYLEFTKKRFAQNFVYRANALFRLLRSFIYLFVTVSIWTALYRGTPEVGGISLKEMLTYVLMARVVNALIDLPVSKYIAGKIANGTISIDFIRPVKLHFCAFADCAGGVLAQLLLSTVPMVIAGALIWGFVLPATAWQWVFFILSLCMAIVMYSMMEYLMGLSAFWLKTDWYMEWIIGSFMTLFSGAFIPLWFYPVQIKIAADLLPFKYFIFEPINIFLGKTSFNGAMTILGMQLMWIAVFYAAGRIMWKYAQKTITVHGG
jgi:ABC-2 type transport system permease protein